MACLDKNRHGFALGPWSPTVGARVPEWPTTEDNTCFLQMLSAIDASRYWALSSDLPDAYMLIFLGHALNSFLNPLFPPSPVIPCSSPMSECTDECKSRSWLALLKSFHLFPKNGILDKTSSSYIALFRPLQDAQSRLILCCAVVLALAAGAPLPIIGVIFARIIDSFPPSEEEVQTRICQLLAVGKCIG